MPSMAYAVAIVGVGGIFPAAPTAEALWQLVINGDSAAREVPADRWPVPPRSLFDAVPGTADRTYSLRACLLDSLPASADLPDLPLSRLDPALRLLVAAGHQLWRHGRGEGLNRSRVGVILGNLALPSESSSALARQLLAGGPPVHPLNRFVAGLPAGVLAQALGLGGPHCTLDAACASSLYALKLACDELTEGRTDAMIAGGLSRPDSLYTQMGFAQLRALSPRGVCSPFDHRGDGLVVGEGCGLFLLKRLHDAERDGDRILGVIRAVGLANDVGGSLLAPASEGQLRAMRAAYTQAGWSPETVELIECHATGTPVGDAVEFASLRQLWQEAAVSAGRCVIGSVKSNIGHLLTAAGAAALVKTLAALQQAQLPPTAGFERAGETIPLDGSPFRILQRPETWPTPADNRPRRAAVSAFGFGGINAHLLVEEYRSDRFDRSAPSELPERDDPIAVVGLEVRLAPDLDAAASRARLLGADAPAGAIATDWPATSTGSPVSGRLVRQLLVPTGQFRIPPREMAEMLPQQLLMLQTAAAALADAGDTADALRTGVYVGIAFDQTSTGYSLRWALGATGASAGPALNANRVMGSLGNIVANRVAREFGFGGPAHTFSAEGISALHALHAAVGALRRGEIDRALLGSVDLPGDPRMASGAVPVQEGAVALVLMRLEEARQQQRPVYGVIREVALSGGHGVAAPLPEAVRRQLRERLPLERSPAASLDLTEADLLHRFGDSGALAGGLGLAQALLALQQGVRPTASGPRFWLANADELPRRARLSLGSIDGGLGGVLLEEAPTELARTATSPIGDWPEGLFAVRGDTPAALAAGLRRLRELAAQNGGPDIAKLASHWLQQSDAGRLTVALVAASPAQLVQQLDLALDHLQQQPHRPLGTRDSLLPAFARDRLFYRPEPLADQGELALLYPGMGNPYPGAGARLSARFPSIFLGQQQANRRLRDQYRAETFWPEDGRLDFSDQNALVIGQVAYGTALTDLLRRLGLKPQAAIGYSLGESTALFALQAWPDRDGMLQRLERSPLFVNELAGPCRAAGRRWRLPEGTPADWACGVINRPAAAVHPLLAAFPRAYLLIINGPEECVLGGQRQQVEALVRELGGHFFPLEGVSAVHCEVVQEVAEAYRDLHRFDTVPPAGIRFYCGATGTAYLPERERCADAVLAQALATVDYTRVIDQAWRDGVRLFVEIGPGNSCSRMVGQILGDRPHLARSASQPALGEEQALTRLLAELLAEGVSLDLVPLFPAQPTVTAAAAPLVIERNLQAVPAQPAAAASAPAPVPAVAPPLAPTPPSLPAAMVAPTAALALLQQISTDQAVAHQVFLQTMDLLQQALIRQTTPSAATTPSAPRPLFDRQQCFEFAIGRVSAMLGPDFAEVDGFPSRVRLPDAPLQLVDRITELDGTPRSMGPGRVVTEHDVLPGAWYLDGGRAPTCISVEAGQADLFLSGYLGIDFQHRGTAVYRLLDAIVTFHRDLPRPGETIRYDIHIDHFFRQGDTWLFRFWFDGTIAGKPFITMRQGCAGFFSAAELAAGKGIVHTKLDLREQPGKKPQGWQPLLPMARESYTDTQLDALRRGDLAGCFGPAFAGLPLSSPLTLPGGRMKLVDRILELDPQGGRFGLGQIRGEADIHPDDWFLTCHFCDDHVMPGTLMYECCQHTLRVLLLRMGWVTDAPGAVWQPVPEIGNQLKCRGQVIESTRKVEYRLTLKEIGFRPEPYAIADALMLADGRPIVEVINLSVMLSGTDLPSLQRLWQGRGQAGVGPRAPIFNTDRITAFAVGKPSDAFGEPYRVFDSERKIARLPGPPFQFLDRITDIQAEPWVLKEGGSIEAQYDVPADAWYFGANRAATMPFCVLLETALQPCGWLAAYLGSALTSDVDLRFRNLDGHAVQLREVTPESGTLTTRVKITRVAKSGGMIIQAFDFELADAQGPVYRGDTVFGFFTAEALANQVGVRDAVPWQPSAAEVAQARRFDYPAGAPFPEPKLRMIDRVALYLPAGGSQGLGFLRGEMDVNPAAWFFQAHFYQDPVVPGSLGLESLLQLLKVAAAQRWGVTPQNRFETVALGKPQRWSYRGQVIPANRRVTVEAIITAIDDDQRLLTADGWLQVDGKIIYKMQDFTLKLH